jgi:hypothetical protein
MNCVGFAEFAVFTEFKSIRVVFFVFHRAVVSLLAFGAGKRNFNPHDAFPPLLSKLRPPEDGRKVA